MTQYEPIKRWEIPAKALEFSCSEMAIDGQQGNEGVALWLGQRQAGISKVCAVAVLRGPGIIKRPALLNINANLMNEVTDAAIDRNLTLVGQIHSHGTHFGTDLSLTDRRYGVLVSDYLSVVAPDYALRPVTRIEDCGVHVYRSDIGYVRLTPAEVASRVIVTNEQEASILTIGG